MYNKLGADTGFDSIGEFTTAKAMSSFLNELNMEGKLTRTILYTLNPCANEVIATMPVTSRMVLALVRSSLVLAGGSTISSMV